jgi:DNA-binding transcriptional LysR family regulator
LKFLHYLFDFAIALGYIHADRRLLKIGLQYDWFIYDLELLTYARYWSDNRPMTDWDDYRFFLAVARETSVRKAASALGVSHSTVLRRITAFEEMLGVRLFERLPTGYFTTDAGDELRRSALRIEEEASAANRRIAGRDTRLNGTLTVTMPNVFATHLLMPDMAIFRQTYPGIELEIIPTYSLADLARREADVAIRVSNDPPEDLFGRRILQIAKAAYVCEDYLPDPGRGIESQSLHWIGGMGAPLSLQWMQGSNFPNIPTGPTINDPYATLEAVKAGMGMAMLPCFMADADSQLYRMPPGTLVRMDLWVLTHEDMRNTARIRKFISFMADAILKYRNLLEGKMPRALPVRQLHTSVG